MMTDSPEDYKKFEEKWYQTLFMWGWFTLVFSIAIPASFFITIFEWICLLLPKRSPLRQKIERRRAINREAWSCFRTIRAGEKQWKQYNSKSQR